jgi:hypothetical protein
MVNALPPSGVLPAVGANQKGRRVSIPPSDLPAKRPSLAQSGASKCFRELATPFDGPRQRILTRVRLSVHSLRTNDTTVPGAFSSRIAGRVRSHVSSATRFPLIVAVAVMNRGDPAVDVVQHLRDHDPLDTDRRLRRGRGSTEVVRPGLA